jgi:hypothetical protein
LYKIVWYDPYPPFKKHRDCVPGISTTQVAEITPGFWSSVWDEFGPIPIYPTLNLEYSITTPLEISTKAGVIIQLQTPPYPYIAHDFTVKDFEFHCIINKDWFNKTIKVPCNVTFTEVDGEFNASYPLATIKTPFSVNDFHGDIKFTFSILGCLDPAPPIGWINILVKCESTFKTRMGNSYSVSCQVACPIVSMDD